MKIIISENQVNKIDKLRNGLNEYISNYINNYITGSYLRHHFDNFIIYFDPNGAIFDDTMIEHDTEDGRLFIDYDVVMSIANMFGLTPTEAQLKIHDWFRKTEGIHAEYLDTQGGVGSYYFK